MSVFVTVQWHADNVSGWVRSGQAVPRALGGGRCAPVRGRAAAVGIGAAPITSAPLPVAAGRRSMNDVVRRAAAGPFSRRRRGAASAPETDRRRPQWRTQRTDCRPAAVVQRGWRRTARRPAATPRTQTTDSWRPAN